MKKFVDKYSYFEYTMILNRQPIEFCLGLVVYFINYRFFKTRAIDDDINKFIASLCGIIDTLIQM